MRGAPEHLEPWDGAVQAFRDGTQPVVIRDDDPHRRTEWGQELIAAAFPSPPRLLAVAAAELAAAVANGATDLVTAFGQQLAAQAPDSRQANAILGGGRLTPLLRCGQVVEAILRSGEPQPTLLLLEGADQLMGIPSADDCFRMLRGWCGNRRPPWSNFRLLLTTSVPAAQLVASGYGSHFNTAIELSTERAQGTTSSGLQAGGPVGERGLYVERAADKELFAALKARHYCHLLAPRQIGKSSLRQRVTHRLAAEGVRCVTLDLARIGTAESLEQWYSSLAHLLAQELHLEVELATVWQHSTQLTPTARWTAFLREKVIGAPASSLVIFLEEVDLIRTQPFVADEFFRALRAFRTEPEQHPEFQRVTFCLIGVCSPTALVEDKQSTPFNVSTGIRLEDFSRPELDGFGAEVARRANNPAAVLDEVYAWTHGHPYMTQRLLLALPGSLTTPLPAGEEQEKVKAQVDELFLRDGRSQDTSLSYIERWFQAPALTKRLQRADQAAHDKQVRQQLAVYRKVLEREVMSTDDNTVLELRLLGLVADRDEAGARVVCVRNQIVATVFDKKWLADHEQRFNLFGEAFLDWVHSGATLAERDEEFLLRDHRLEEALQLTGAVEQTPEENDYLLASQRQQQLRERDQHKTRIRNARLFGIAMAATIALIAFGVYTMAFLRFERAQRLALTGLLIAKDEPDLGIVFCNKAITLRQDLPWGWLGTPPRLTEAVRTVLGPYFAVRNI